MGGLSDESKVDVREPGSGQLAPLRGAVSTSHRAVTPQLDAVVIA